MIHARALVDATSEVGDGTRVWQFASVIRRAYVGPEGSVGSCAIVDGSRIGARAKIGHGAQIHPGCVAGHDLFLGPGAIICNDLWPWLGGKDFDLDALIEGRELAVICEDRVTIGAGAIILPGVRLGEGCVVAAGAVCTGDVPPRTVLLRDGRHVPVQSYDGAARMQYAA